MDSSPAFETPTLRYKVEGMIDTARLRVATNGDMRLRGYGIVSDRNGAFTLAFKADGIDNIIYLNTQVWKIEWEDQNWLKQSS